MRVLRILLALLSLVCGGCNHASPRPSLASLRSLYDEFQWTKPVSSVEVQRSRTFQNLVSERTPEDVLPYYRTEPQLRPFILQYLEARRDQRAIEGLIGALADPDPGLLFRSHSGAQLIALTDEIASTLAVLTSVDFGTDRGRWATWWDQNRNRFPPQISW